MGHGTRINSRRETMPEGLGDEYHFLRDYQLSIYKEEDREEGRRIVQGLVEHQKRETEASKTQSTGQAVGVRQYLAL
jgi:hypothetical protein